MKNLYLVCITITIALTLICYIATNNIYCALIVLVISSLYFIFRFVPKFKKSNLKVERFHTCYHFINNFIITLSIKQSIKAAYQDNIANFDDDLKVITSGIEDLNENEKINYLSNEFPFHIYSLFLNIVSLYEEQGGDILKMSAGLINETRNVEEYLINCQRLGRKKYIDFTILWGFSLAILIALRFSLKEFYDKMQSNIMFPISITFLFVFVIFSIELLTNTSLNYDLKGWDKKYEKNI